MKGALINMKQAWDKEKISQKSEPWPPEHRAGAHPPSYENSWRARSFNWVYMWDKDKIWVTDRNGTRLNDLALHEFS